MVPNSASFAYDTCVRLLDEIAREVATIDSNAGVLIAADGVIVGFLLGRAPAQSGGLIAAGSIASTLVLASLALAVIAFAVRVAESAPDVRSLIGSVNLLEESLKWEFVGNLADTVADNRARLRRKALYLAAAQAGLLAALLPAGAYLLLSGFGRST